MATDSQKAHILLNKNHNQIWSFDRTKPDALAGTEVFGIGFEPGGIC
jgi:hypothetical protein